MFRLVRSSSMWATRGRLAKCHWLISVNCIVTFMAAWLFKPKISGSTRGTKSTLTITKRWLTSHPPFKLLGTVLTDGISSVYSSRILNALNEINSCMLVLVTFQTPKAFTWAGVNRHSRQIFVLQAGVFLQVCSASASCPHYFPHSKQRLYFNLFQIHDKAALFALQRWHPHKLSNYSVSFWAIMVSVHANETSLYSEVPKLLPFPILIARHYPLFFCNKISKAVHKIPLLTSSHFTGDARTTTQGDDWVRSDEKHWACLNMLQCIFQHKTDEAI